MIYALAFYWVIAAVAMFMSNPDSVSLSSKDHWAVWLLIIIFCFVFGGLFVPARLMIKYLR